MWSWARLWSRLYASSCQWCQHRWGGICVLYKWTELLPLPLSRLFYFQSLVNKVVFSICRLQWFSWGFRFQVRRAETQEQRGIKEVEGDSETSDGEHGRGGVSTGSGKHETSTAGGGTGEYNAAHEEDSCRCDQKLAMIMMMILLMMIMISWRFPGRWLPRTSWICVYIDISNDEVHRAEMTLPDIRN